VDRNIVKPLTCLDCGGLLPPPAASARSKPPSTPKTIEQIYDKLSRLEVLIVGNQTRWRTVSQAAEYIGVSRRTIQRYIKDSSLHSYVTPSGIIRINQNDIDAWVMFGRAFKKLTRPQKEQLIEVCR